MLLVTNFVQTSIFFLEGRKSQLSSNFHDLLTFSLHVSGSFIFLRPPKTQGFCTSLPNTLDLPRLEPWLKDLVSSPVPSSSLMRSGSLTPGPPRAGYFSPCIDHGYDFVSFVRLFDRDPSPSPDCRCHLIATRTPSLASPVPGGEPVT